MKHSRSMPTSPSPERPGTGSQTCGRWSRPESAIEPAELAGILRDAFFSPSDESDADSWETQRTRFEEEAMHVALSLLCSEEEARKGGRSPVRCVANCPGSCHGSALVTITVRDGEVYVGFASGEDSR